MRGQFDPAYVAAFFDAYGYAEWDRHDASAAARVGFAVHADLLADVIRAGDLVLDAGAGPGRFTIELARLRARVHVGDLSPGQLNERKVAEAGHADAVVAREVMDAATWGTWRRRPSTRSSASVVRSATPAIALPPPSPSWCA